MILHAQIPERIIKEKKLSNLQFRIYSLLEFYRFTKEPDKTSDRIASALGVHRDTIRRELNKMQQIFSDELDNFISIYFLQKHINEPSQIIIHWNYLETVSIIDGDNIKLNTSDLAAIKFTLTTSKHFHRYKPEILFTIAGTDKTDELIKAITFVDQKKKVKQPLPYLRSCFVDGLFKFDKAIVSLAQINGKLPKGIKIDSNFLYGLTNEQFQILKSNKTDEYKFHSFQDNYERIIYYCSYKTKPANIRNALNQFQVKYSVYLKES